MYPSCAPRVHPVARLTQSQMHLLRTLLAGPMSRAACSWGPVGKAGTLIRIVGFFSSQFRPFDYNRTSSHSLPRSATRHCFAPRKLAGTSFLRIQRLLWPFILPRDLISAARNSLGLLVRACRATKTFAPTATVHMRYFAPSWVIAVVGTRPRVWGLFRRGPSESLSNHSSRPELNMSHAR